MINKWNSHFLKQMGSDLSTVVCITRTGLTEWKWSVCELDCVSPLLNPATLHAVTVNWLSPTNSEEALGIFRLVFFFLHESLCRGPRPNLRLHSIGHCRGGHMDRCCDNRHIIVVLEAECFIIIYTINDNNARGNYLHHCVARGIGIDNTADCSVEAAADCLVPVGRLAVPGEEREVAGFFHIGKSLGQHVGTILHNRVWDVWHRLAGAVWAWNIQRWPKKRRLGCVNSPLAQWLVHAP